MFDRRFDAKADAADVAAPSVSLLHAAGGGDAGGEDDGRRTFGIQKTCCLSSTLVLLQLLMGLLSPT